MLGRRNVVGVLRRTRNLQRSSTRVIRWFSRVCLSLAPIRTSHVINFDLYHLFDAIATRGTLNLFLFGGVGLGCACGCCGITFSVKF